MILSSCPPHPWDDSVCKIVSMILFYRFYQQRFLSTSLLVKMIRTGPDVSQEKKAKRVFSKRPTV